MDLDSTNFDIYVEDENELEILLMAQIKRRKM
jgi:hypothetical protein